MTVMCTGSSYSTGIPSLEFVGLPQFQRHGWFSAMALSRLMTLNLDRLTFELVRIVINGMDNLPANFLRLFIVELGKPASD